MATRITHSLQETLSLGEEWGRNATPGWLIAVSGDLGAGKTQLVKGIARGLGIEERVHSPTFAIVNLYTSGRLPLAHLDLYRLESPAAIQSAGVEECFTPLGVTVIEWAERWLGEIWGPFPGTRLRRVRIAGLDETTRQIDYEDFGD